MKDVVVIVALVGLGCWLSWLSIKFARSVKVLQDALVSARWLWKACHVELKDKNASS